MRVSKKLRRVTAGKRTKEWQWQIKRTRQKSRCRSSRRDSRCWYRRFAPKSVVGLSRRNLSKGRGFLACNRRHRQMASHRKCIMFFLLPNEDRPGAMLNELQKASEKVQLIFEWNWRRFFLLSTTITHAVRVCLTLEKGGFRK